MLPAPSVGHMLFSRKEHLPAGGWGLQGWVAKIDGRQQLPDPREPTPPRSARVSPAPAALPARSQRQWRPREHNWDRPPPKAI